jgi:site-specific DNA recombinase
VASVYRDNGVGKVTSAIPTALLYTRVSKDEMAREGLSLDAQLDNCRRYAANKGWLIGTEYQDILTGRRDDRPAYQQMLSDVRRLCGEGRSVVVVAWLHRLGRRVLERVRCREELKALGVPLYSVAEGGEVSDLVANILASVAEEEVRQLGERVQAVNVHLARTGWARPGRCTWGYRWRKPSVDERASGAPKAVLEADPETAPFAQEAYRKAAAGESVRAVLRWAAALPTSARGPRGFNYRSIYQILTSPTYIAHAKIDGELLPGRWPALIDRTTWDRVQERIAEHHHMPHQASGRYLATGLLRCPNCGARMQGTPNRRERVRPLYRCHDTFDGHAESIRANCGFSARQATIDDAVLGQ